MENVPWVVEMLSEKMLTLLGARFRPDYTRMLRSRLRLQNRDLEASVGAIGMAFEIYPLRLVLRGEVV